MTRNPLTLGVIFLLGACALFGPSQERFVVFFEHSSAQLMDPAKAVLSAAAEYANKHPDRSVIVASYADPYGDQKAIADFTRLRAQLVIDELVKDGVPAARIQRRDVGSVAFQSDSQESRRVEITFGNP